MTKQELERAIKVGRTALCVDASAMEGFPSRVREITILNNTVVLEFNVYDHDEAGPRYVAHYSDVDLMISSLEDYLMRSLSEWENHTATGAYPAPPEGWSGVPDKDEGERLVAAVAARTIRLPNLKFRQTSSYWAEVEATGLQSS